jgi:hypothetical protein
LTPLPLDSKTSPTLSALLSTLTPLAFISQRSGTAQATQLYDPTADAFLYSVGVSSFGYVAATGLTDPDTVYFFYDDTNRTNQNLAKGQIVAKFLLPLTVLNSNGTETAVPTTLQFRANNAGDCSTSTVVGNFSRASSGTQTLMAAQIGIDCAVVFSASPTSRQKHAIFEVAVPVLVTGACSPTPPATSCMPYTDPAYFYSLHNPGPPAKTNPVNTGVYTAFLFDDANGILGQGASIGLAPSAGPLGSPPPTGVTSSFALCANLPGGSGNGQAPIPSVGAYYAVATSGEIFLSAPLPSASTSACPPM